MCTFAPFSALSKHHAFSEWLNCWLSFTIVIYCLDQFNIISMCTVDQPPYYWEARCIDTSRYAIEIYYSASYASNNRNLCIAAYFLQQAQYSKIHAERIEGLCR